MAIRDKACPEIQSVHTHLWVRTIRTDALKMHLCKISSWQSEMTDPYRFDPSVFPKAIDPDLPPAVVDAIARRAEQVGYSFTEMANYLLCKCINESEEESR